MGDPEHSEHSGHAHGHSHGPLPKASPVIRRRLTIVMIPLIIATAVGVVALWPAHDRHIQGAAGPPAKEYRAVVTTTSLGCSGTPAQPNFSCYTLNGKVTSGPDAGTAFSFQVGLQGAGQRPPEPGDSILVAQTGAPGAGPHYTFVDYQRGTPLFALAILFALVVVFVGRWRGMASIIGLAISILGLIYFVVPAVLQGEDPVTVSIVGSVAILLAALYLAYGINVRTTAAVLGTLLSLGLTAGLAFAFSKLSHFTGFASEEALSIQAAGARVNLTGLLLAGIVIGTLGILQDVTVTQASAVWELRLANPGYGIRGLYRSAMRIGRDHIASTVNTLVLAYAGAGLPLLILFNLSRAPLGHVLTTEIVAQEIVRTLVGSIGLVAAVPITTALSALVVGHEGAAGSKRTKRRATGKPSKFEQEWFGDAPPASRPSPSE